MRRLIVTPGDSEAGCLKQTRLADRVLPLRGNDLVNAPPPSEREIEAFFGPSRHAAEPGWQAWITAHDGVRDETDHHLGLPDVLAASDVVELWFGPDPRSQIQLAKLLWYVERTGCGIDTLVLARLDFGVTDYGSAGIVMLKPCRNPLTRAQLLTGHRLWNAFTGSTPEALVDLLAEDLSALPDCGQTVLRLLAELPSIRTGLGHAETRLLTLVGLPGATWISVAGGYAGGDRPPTIAWHQAELMLDHLASCAAPLVSGFVLDPFRDPPEPNDGFDRDLFHRHRRTPLSLTPLGHEVARREADFTRHNPIDRWLGGTRLVPGNLWRWDGMRCTLTPP